MPRFIKDPFIIEILLIMLVGIGMLCLLYFSIPKKGEIIRIDCTWSEISPDFSNEIRELCRKERAKKSLTLPK